MAHKLRKARIAKGISQLQLSFLAGVSRFRLNLAERELIDFRSDEVAHIKKALGKVKTSRGGTKRKQRVLAEIAQ